MMTRPAPPTLLEQQLLQQQHHHQQQQQQQQPLAPLSSQLQLQQTAMLSQAQQQQPQNDDPSTRSSLWMGDLEAWMDEVYLRQLWFSLGHNVSVKLVRSKTTGQPAGYCFLDFPNPQGAQHAMEHINGLVIPNTNTYFRLNWSSGGYTTGMRFDPGPEFSLFVGNLGREVNDYLLFTTFHPRYPNCKSAKVVTDPQTGNSKGFGFVRFGDESECHRALFEMNGHFCGMNAMRLDLATPRTRTPGGGLSGTYSSAADTFAHHLSASAPAQAQQPQSHHQHQQQQQQLQQHTTSQSAAPDSYDPSADPFNTKVFVGGLAAHVTEDELRVPFSVFGEIVYVKIPSGKGCGFVHFATRTQAENAINNLNGTLLGGYPIRLTWARSAGSDKQQLRSNSAPVFSNLPPVQPTTASSLSAAFSSSASASSYDGAFSLSALSLALPGLPSPPLSASSASAQAAGFNGTLSAAASLTSIPRAPSLDSSSRSSSAHSDTSMRDTLVAWESKLDNGMWIKGAPPSNYDARSLPLYDGRSELRMDRFDGKPERFASSRFDSRLDNLPQSYDIDTNLLSRQQYALLQQQQHIRQLQEQHQLQLQQLQQQQQRLEQQEDVAGLWRFKTNSPILRTDRILTPLAP